MTAAFRLLVALIRAIDGATHRAMPLADLCRGLEAAGFGGTQLFLDREHTSARRQHAERRRALDRGTIAVDGVANRVFARRPSEIRRALAADPFPDTSRGRPARMLVTFFDDPAPRDAVRTLADRAGSERVAANEPALCIDLAAGIGVSKPTPAVNERAAVEPGTARHRNTLRGILKRL